jgi:2-polyprenyl-3-methyl-5-hydroxy-6-metoxy-1,4-benzoquinol methylase
MKERFREFYETVGKNYPEDEIVYGTLSGQLRKKWIINKLQDFPPGNLLDCGCNIGTLSKSWYKGSVFGVDIAYSVLLKGRRETPRINFLQADLRSLSMFKHGSIDNAMACEVIEHLDRPDRFFRKLYPAMRKGGWILVTSPNFTGNRPQQNQLGILRTFGIITGTEGVKYLHTAYKPPELAAMAERAGFKIIEQGSFEFELRGWLKPLTILRRLLNSCTTRFSPTSRMIYLIEGAFGKIETNTFWVLSTFNFAWLLKKFFPEGRRSYIVAAK